MSRLIAPTKHRQLVRQRIPTPKERTEFQRRMVAEAFAKGEEKNFYWIIRMILPPRYWKGPDDNGDDRTACWPGEKIPLVCVADDPTGDFADLLAEVFAVSNPRDTVFYKALTNTEILEREVPGRWYVWGELMEDRICQKCGQVYHVKVIDPNVFCDCAVNSPPKPDWLWRVTRAYDGENNIMWERVL